MGNVRPAVAQDEYVDDEESDPRLIQAMRAYLAELAAMTPPEVVGDTIATGVQRGGTEIRFVVPGTQVLVREEGDDPRDAPPPAIYGEEICPSERVEGQFEPAQGSWQDDPTFVDKPGKQITRLSRVLYRAEMRMVTGRWSLLHGIDRAVGGSEPRRDEIFIKGEATGSTLVPVKFRFTLKQPGRVTIIHESEVVGQIPIGGPCGPPTPFEVSLDASDGIPPRGSFVFHEEGEYLIEAELVREDGSGTGLKVGVVGNAVTTHAPSLAFRMVTILESALEDVMRPQLEEAARELAEDSAVRIPDFFPIENAALKTRVFPPRDRRDLLDIKTKNLSLTQFLDGLGPELVRTYLKEAIREELARELQVGGLMSGFDRIVVLTTDADFRLLWMGSLADPDAVAFATSQKVVFVNLEVSGDVYTVAHELAHTMPFSFAEEEMTAECGLNYHGLAAEKVAHGHMVSFGVRPRRARRDDSPHVMGASPKGMSQWIEQCTYRHLLEFLSAGEPDPRVLLIQGFVGRHDGRLGGVFQPFYELDGVVDLPEGDRGSWAIVLKDPRGRVLSRHAWEPRWSVPHLGAERNLIAFAFRLLRPEGLASVELEGPEGVLDSRRLSAAPPSVSIVRPADGAPANVERGEVAVEWALSDPDNDPLLSTLLYSSDGGETWIDVVVETGERSARVRLDPEAPAEAHRLLVRATDGSRSSEAVVSFRSDQ